MKLTDTQILNWLQAHPWTIVCHKPGKGRRYWRRTFCPKDATNRFTTLRAAVTEAICQDYYKKPSTPMPTTTNDKGEQPTTLYPRTDETLGVLTSAGSSHPFDGSEADWMDFKTVCKQRDALVAALTEYMAAEDAPNPPSERPTPQEWDECGPINKPMPSERPDDNPEQWTAVPPRPISPAPVPEGREGTPIPALIEARDAIILYLKSRNPHINEQKTIDSILERTVAAKIREVQAVHAKITEDNDRLESALTASQSRETELRAAWNAREPQLYAAERTVDELRARVAELEKERDEWRDAERRLSEAYVRLRAMIPGAFNTPPAPSAEQVWAVTESALSSLQKELERAKLRMLESDEGSAMLADSNDKLRTQLAALREAGQELAGAAQEAIKHGEVLGESEFPTPALGLLRSSILRWEDVKWHQSIAAPMGREGASDKPTNNL